MEVDESGKFTIFKFGKCKAMPCNCTNKKELDWIIFTVEASEKFKKNTFTLDEQFITKINLKSLSKEEKSLLERAISAKGLKKLKKAIRRCLKNDAILNSEELKQSILSEFSEEEEKPKKIIRKPRKRID